jgi:hypothetical protein
MKLEKCKKRIRSSLHKLLWFCCCSNSIPININTPNETPSELTHFVLFCLASEEADTLEELKKTTAEEQAKANKRRMKFQAQDSVLVEPMGASMEE